MIDPTRLAPAQPDGGLSSFANLLMIILGIDETDKDFTFADYLSCLGLMPGTAPRPAHPMYFHTSFPPEGPMEVLPRDVAERMEASFAELREIRSRLADDDRDNKIAAETTDELGRKAMAAVRRIGAALGYRRWESGETMVKMLQLKQALPADEVDGAELVQATDEFGSETYVWENPDESDNRVRVSALRLVFRLAPTESIENVTPAKLAEWRTRSQRIGAVFNALFPGEHCIVEFRDHSAAMVSRIGPIGPSYAEVVAKRASGRSKPD